VARFIGSAQFLDGSIKGPRSGSVETVFRTGSGLDLVGRTTTDLAAGTEAKAVIRPEDACLERPAEPSNAINVRVVAQVYLGDRIRCQVIFPDATEGMVWVDHHEATRVRVGDEVTLYWPCARTVFVI
jgi:ABC-type Fe3+/spermidine/putrescine transport system ATPase subunit